MHCTRWRLVNHEGSLVDIIDIQQWAQPLVETPLPVPSATRYQAHCRATLSGGYLSDSHPQ